MLHDGVVPWWPGVRLEPAPTEPVAGTTLLLVVRSPLGYRLRTKLRLTLVDGGREVAARATGDLQGSGSITVRAVPGGSILTFRWEVQTERGWMNVLAPVMRPAFVAAHHRVMRHGERGLRAALER